LTPELIEIKDYQQEGFMPLVSFGGWRVAVLRFLDDLKPENIKTLERHLKTDEVFILVKGSGMLLVGGNHEQPADIQSFIMEIGKVYNIKQNTWHSISLTNDAHVILVENDDTNSNNSEIAALNENDKLLTKNVVTAFLNEIN
jgi:ureidoglycolate hydrolase